MRDGSELRKEMADVVRLRQARNGGGKMDGRRRWDVSGLVMDGRPNEERRRDGFEDGGGCWR